MLTSTEHAFETALFLDKTVVLCPSYGPIEEHTEQCLNWMTGMHAGLIRTSQCSDIAWHRCLIATAAYDALKAKYADRAYVLWLDADVSIEQAELLQLYEDLADLYGHQQQGAWRYCPSVTARYLGRRVNLLEAVRKLDAPLAPTSHRTLLPVISGLGCFLSRIETFKAHVERSPRALLSSFDDSETVYCVSWSTPVRASNNWTWAGDAWSYCAEEWNMGGGVYLSRARARHSRRTVIMPPDDLWLPEPQDDTHGREAMPPGTTEPHKRP
jgi:hypothetical protein